MKGLSVLLICFSLFLMISLVRETNAAETQSDGIYIVYMGAAASPDGTTRDDQAQLLTSLITRKQNALVHSYKHGFSGLAAHLTKEEALSIAQKPGIVSVFPDPLLKLHTTRSWDFLKYQTDLEIHSSSDSDFDSLSQGSDTIIGILDTGIWPESESFNDKDMGPIPSRWKGICMEGQNFTSSNCNRKLIGARYYHGAQFKGYFDTPRDLIGHGTHVASTAAGRLVAGASYYGLAMGTAKGGSPGSRVAVYSVCTPEGCRGSSILAAFDDAIEDGVDVLSLSLGASADVIPDFSSDPIAIGAFHAVEKGISVVCSAGNDGPYQQTVVNIAPWIITVAATTIDRDFESDVILGGGQVIKGGGIHFGNIGKSPVYPLINGSSAKSSYYDNVDDARVCNPESLDEDKVRGNILLCYDDMDGENMNVYKVKGLKELGGVGIILINDEARTVASTYGDFPISVITSEDTTEIFSYVNSTRNPVATILPTVTINNYKPAPVVPYFSSRGPSTRVKNIIKPDIAAPGVDIIAAWIGNDRDAALPHKPSPLFNVLSGTSMACPHISGIAATIKSQYPTWNPSAIRSAMMTTATQTNNVRGSITDHTGSTMATAYDYGAGEVSTSRALQPGLIYETNNIDYLQFLCNYGYDLPKIKLMSSAISDGFSCPKNSSTDFISNLNYPSIAISKFNFNGKERKKVVRTVTHVGAEDETLYMATVVSFPDLEVQVRPNKLQFTKNCKKLSYQVIFTSTTTLNATSTLVSGSVMWTNGHYTVRTPFVVSSN